MIGALVLMAGFGLMSAESSQGLPEHCLKALSALAAGSVPIVANFAAVECPNKAPMPTFHYDKAAGASRLSRSVAQDEVVPLFPEFGQKLVQPGQMLRIVVFSGAVRVEREVETLQTARPGQRLFVRSSDGQVLSVRYEGRP